MSIKKRKPVDPTWRTRAQCRLGNSGWWTSDDPGELEKAKTICATLCPVREECLRTGLANGEAYTVWGAIYLDPSKNYVLCKICKYGCGTGTKKMCEYCKTWKKCDGGCGRVVKKTKAKTDLCTSCKTMLEVTCPPPSKPTPSSKSVPQKTSRLKSIKPLVPIS